MMSQHKVSALFSVTTAFRVTRRVDPDIIYGSKYNISSLRTIFIAGEHCDLKTKAWIESTFKVPALNNWWQTETGSAITASCVGFGHSINPPKHTTGLPFVGYNSKLNMNVLAPYTNSLLISVRVLNKNGTEAQPTR